jgi:hypothetical protein
VAIPEVDEIVVFRNFRYEPTNASCAVGPQP